MNYAEERQCPVCGERFVSSSNRRKYCSDICRDKQYATQSKGIAQKLTNDQLKGKRCLYCAAPIQQAPKGRKMYCGLKCEKRFLYNTSPEERAEVRRLIRVSKSGPREAQWPGKYEHANVCRFCGEQFQGTHDQKYCGDECRRSAQIERRREQRKSERKVMRSACLLCGKAFTKKNDQQKYCSRECGVRYRNTHPEEELRCKHCGKIYLRSADQDCYVKYCSFECRLAAENIKKQAKIENKALYICQNCGREFHCRPASAGREPKFCSKECYWNRRWYESTPTGRPKRMVTAHNPALWQRQLARAANIGSAPACKRRIILVCGSTEGRYGLARLISIIEHKLNADPCSGDLYVFCDAAHTSLRYLEWDGAGFCLGHRKAQTGTYPWLSDEFCATVEITEEEFEFLRSRSTIKMDEKP